MTGDNRAGEGGLRLRRVGRAGMIRAARIADAPGPTIFLPRFRGEREISLSRLRERAAARVRRPTPRRCLAPAQPPSLRPFPAWWERGSCATLLAYSLSRVRERAGVRVRPPASRCRLAPARLPSLCLSPAGRERGRCATLLAFSPSRVRKRAGVRVRPPAPRRRLAPAQTPSPCPSPAKRERGPCGMLPASARPHGSRTRERMGIPAAPRVRSDGPTPLQPASRPT